MSLAKQSIIPFLGTFTPKQLQQHRAELRVDFSVGEILKCVCLTGRFWYLLMF